MRQRLLAVLRHRVLSDLRRERFADEGPGSLGVVHRPEAGADDAVAGEGRG